METVETKLVSTVSEPDKRGHGAASCPLVHGRVLREARARFLRVGFSAVTLDELASELGMSKKTLYRFFPDKEALLRAVVVDFQKEMAAGLDGILENPKSDFVEKLTGMMRFLAERLSTMSPAAMADIRRHAPQVWSQIEEFRRQGAFLRLGSLIREGMRQGYLRKDIESADLVLLVYIEVIQRVLAPEQLSRMGLTPDQAFRTLRRVLLGGLLTRHGRTAMAARRKTRTGFHHQDTKAPRIGNPENQPPRTPRTPRIRRINHRRTPTNTDRWKSGDSAKTRRKSVKSV